VAIAILRDDYEPAGGVIYFRQRVLSKYNGVSLTADPKADEDVPTSFGDAHEVKVATTQDADQHVEVPTTMYLLVDHPQPPALTHAIRLALVPNPNPQHFVAAYDVRSLVLAVSPRRLLGRGSAPASWSPERVKHYTEIPDDPRYRTLADIIVHKLDPRYADDDLAKAFAVKRYLEKNGFYTRKSKHASKKDPTASFLFGSLRGYCVHFAHAGVYLFRSLGIVSRVALGYAVQTRKRSGGSSILIMGDRAHAWPELYLDGVGWVTFDIYPERTDLPPSNPVDYDLEKLLGELARKDPTGGLSPKGEAWEVPWVAMAYLLGLALLALLTLGYLVKGFRTLLPGIVGMSRYPRFAYVAVLDRLSEVGGARRRGESRESHARRLSDVAPSLPDLTRGHLARAFDSPTAPDAAEFREMVLRLRQDLRAHVSWRHRLLGRLNPYSWLRTR
ncbi:MAG: transglutaminase domain-containing protein, partial [Deltaproteobacteria bacterium]|nr:transglutaminase domain-containing protein [Deltaproteobacteria bacterium]